jgi:hypothetical protein
MDGKARAVMDPKDENGLVLILLVVAIGLIIGIFQFFRPKDK